MCHLSRYSVFLIYSSMFLLPLSFSTYRIFRNPCRTDTLFRLQDQDSKLNSNKILSVVVASLSHCARNCLREPNCLSINYNPWISPQTNCEILAGNKSSNGVVLEASTGWKHYSPVTQEVTPACKNSCGLGYTCEEVCEPDNVRHICHDINECASNPCKNGATCKNLVNKYTCTCVPGYTGTNCETEINECASNPCLNGGTCNNLLNKYECKCRTGYNGAKCEKVRGDWSYCSSTYKCARGEGDCDYGSDCFSGSCGDDNCGSGWDSSLDCCR